MVIGLMANIYLTKTTKKMSNVQINGYRKIQNITKTLTMFGLKQIQKNENVLKNTI